MIPDLRESPLNRLRDYYDRVSETWDAMEGTDSYNLHFERLLFMFAIFCAIT